MEIKLNKANNTVCFSEVPDGSFFLYKDTVFIKSYVTSGLSQSATCLGSYFTETTDYNKLKIFKFGQIVDVCKSYPVIPIRNAAFTGTY